MTKTTTVDDLHEGDVIRFGEDGSDFTVRSVEYHSFSRDLRTLKLTNQDPVCIPKGAPIIVVKQLRSEAICCINCNDSFPVQHDHAQEKRVPAIVCEKCFTFVQARVRA